MSSNNVTPLKGFYSNDPFLGMCFLSIIPSYLLKSIPGFKPHPHS
jgi:hypothetical protein